MIRFKLYREYGALNSAPVFDAFEAGIKALGHLSVTANEDVPVIWSVLWRGRMANNQAIFQKFRHRKLPVVILEVGNLKRGVTWKVGVNHINNLGYFGNEFDANRPNTLGIHLREKKNRGDAILIAPQHPMSFQWTYAGSTEKWITNTILAIRKMSSRPIVVRPHPRWPLQKKIPNVTINYPVKIPDSYDSFDIHYHYHAVINFNSSPGPQSVIHGVPVICDISSLAHPVSTAMADVETASVPNCSDWLTQLCHTEWSLSEIATGTALARLLPVLNA